MVVGWKEHASCPYVNGKSLGKCIGCHHLIRLDCIPGVELDIITLRDIADIHPT